MKYQLQAYAIQECGKRIDEYGNPHQEDSMFPTFNHVRGTDRLFILCDGMGGHEGGEVASQAVCDAMANTILPGRDPEGPFTREEFQQALTAAFDALDAKDNGSDRKMGTTLTFLKLHQGGAFIAHIGDSRVYHIRPGIDGATTQILHETSDHSLVNDLVRIGEMTREEAHRSSRKNIITRAMQPGLDPRPKADIYETADIRPGDYFYLCSDGMLEEDAMESGEHLRQIFSLKGGDDLSKVEILKSATADNSDNHTAFIVHITDVTDPVEGPAETYAHNNRIANAAPEAVPAQPVAPPQAPVPAPEAPAAGAPVVPGSPAAPLGVQSQAPAPAQSGKTNSKMIAILVAIIVLLILILTIVALVLFNTVNSAPAQEQEQPEATESVQTPPAQEEALPTPMDKIEEDGEAAKEAGDVPAAPAEAENKEPETVPAVTPEPPAAGSGEETPVVNKEI